MDKIVIYHLSPTIFKKLPLGEKHCDRIYTDYLQRIINNEIDCIASYSIYIFSVVYSGKILDSIYMLNHILYVLMISTSLSLIILTGSLS